MKKNSKKCQCELCKAGRKLERLIEKYKMLKKEKQFLLNDVYKSLEYESFQRYEIEDLKIKLKKYEKNS